ncbi:MAG: hypothetical protein LLG01_02555 [Planctomycetaceae bacterium]|nr:hypothetical protein [Planctomycetaceae bacterium]
MNDFLLHEAMMPTLRKGIILGATILFAVNANLVLHVLAFLIWGAVFGGRESGVSFIPFYHGFISWKIEPACSPFTESLLALVTRLAIPLGLTIWLWFRKSRWTFYAFVLAAVVVVDLSWFWIQRLDVAMRRPGPLETTAWVLGVVGVTLIIFFLIAAGLSTSLLRLNQGQAKIGHLLIIVSAVVILYEAFRWLGYAITFEHDTLNLQFPTAKLALCLLAATIGYRYSGDLTSLHSRAIDNTRGDLVFSLSLMTIFAAVVIWKCPCRFFLSFPYWWHNLLQ